jgi:hypothetical protein
MTKFDWVVKRIPLVLLFLVFTVGGASSQQSKRLAVIDFRNPDNAVTLSEADFITELVRSEARRALPREQYVLMTKENILELLPPDKRDLSQCEGQCEVETGRLIGAQYLVTGEIVNFGGELRVTVRLYDVTTGNLLDSRKAAGKKVLDLETPVEQVASALFAVLPGALQQDADPPEPTPSSSPASSSEKPFVNGKLPVYTWQQRDIDLPEVWTDSTTGLVWQVNPTGGAMDWLSARSHCRDLYLGGHEDWRLPTISELRTLIRGCPATQTGGQCGVTDRCLARLKCWSPVCYGCSGDGGPGFTGVYWPRELFGEPSTFYWSSSEVKDFDLVWGINFYQAAIGGGSHVRCVR